MSKPTFPPPLKAFPDILDTMNKGDLLELLVEVIEHISEAMVVYDKNGRLVRCNRNFCEMYGYTPDEVIPGVHFRELGKIDVERGNVAVGDEHGSGEAYLARKAEYRKKLEGSFIVKLKDGRWIKTTDRPLPNGGFVSVQTDISHEKRIEDQLRQAKDHAERALADNSKLSEELAQKVNLLAKIAATDGLTGLANRIKLDESLDLEIERAKRYSNSSFGLIILDVDHFKMINDRYGHDIGDMVLKAFSDLLVYKVRSPDLVGRWGGEEFMIICPETNLQGVKTLAEGLRSTIENNVFPCVGQKTASFGVTAYRSGDTANTMVKRADIALYRAKNLGRNAVETSE